MGVGELLQKPIGSTCLWEGVGVMGGSLENDI